MRIFPTPPFLLICLLVLYTIAVTYYLYLIHEKHSLEEIILNEKILNLRREYSELTKSINWIESHSSSSPPSPGTKEEKEEQDVLKDVLAHLKGSQPTVPPMTSPPPPRERKPPAVLVVGGTDGSGTRRVVQLLTNLGVLIVSEDPETYDIHADLFGGWPKVVTPILEAAGSITYDTQDLSPQLRSSTEANLRRLLIQAERDSHKPESKTLAVGGALPHSPDVHASDVFYGFKAPVAMTLVPWWRKLNPHFMFLHVLRDGRDIAFSANQGPVTKFYQAMYKNRPEMMVLPPAVKAIQLWGDWNNGIKKWAEKQQKTAPNSESSSFRYLSIHIEDLVCESRDVRYDAIKRIADYVGSDLDDDSLCCLSAQGSKFMGSHDREGRVGENAEQTLKKKYGKWKALLASNPSLEAQLMRAGGDALNDLGYTSPPSQASSSQCSLTIAQCDSKSAGLENWRDAITSPPRVSYASQHCSLEPSTDYPGGDLTVATGIDLDGCCQRCKETKPCGFYTYNTESNTCYLKTTRAKGLKTGASASHLVSGQVLR